MDNKINKTINSDLKLSKSVSVFLTSPDRLLFNLSEKIRNEEYNNQTQDKSISNFIKNYKISNIYKDELKSILKDLDVDFQNSDLNNDWNFIENRIKAQIANSIWGKSEMYKVNLQMDTVAMGAFNHFSKALLLVE